MARHTNMKSRILKVAGEQFFSKGFYKVSVDNLVAELRTSKSSIYKHFSSKEALVAALIEQLNEIINNRLAQIIGDESLTFEEKLETTTRFTAHLFRLISKQFIEDLRIHTPDIWETYEGQRQERVRNYYQQLFRQGMQEGLIRQDLDLELIVLVYLHLTELSTGAEKMTGYTLSSAEIYESINSIFLEGVLGRGGML